MAFQSLNLSCLARMSAEMASCFLTLAPICCSDHLIEVTLLQHRLPLELVRQLLQLLLPEELLLKGHLSKLLMLLQQHPGLINIMGFLTRWTSIWSLPLLLELDLNIQVSCFHLHLLFVLLFPPVAPAFIIE